MESRARRALAITLGVVLTLFITLVIAINVGAAPCVTLAIDPTERLVTSRSTHDTPGLAVDLIGPYLNIQTGDHAGLDERVDVWSVPITDTTISATVCVDGSVELLEAEVTPSTTTPPSELDRPTPAEEAELEVPPSADVPAHPWHLTHSVTGGGYQAD
jgi:hypothetical protein